MSRRYTYDDEEALLFTLHSSSQPRQQQQPPQQQKRPPRAHPQPRSPAQSADPPTSAPMAAPADSTSSGSQVSSSASGISLTVPYDTLATAAGTKHATADQESGFSTPTESTGTGTVLGKSPGSRGSPPSNGSRSNGSRSNGSRSNGSMSSEESFTTPVSSDASNLKGKVPKPRRSRSTHNIIEKKYRTNINSKILELKNAVPTLRAAETKKVDLNELDGLIPANRVNKASILAKATEYIKHLEAKNALLARELDALRAYRVAPAPIQPPNQPLIYDSGPYGNLAAAPFPAAPYPTTSLQPTIPLPEVPTQAANPTQFDHAAAQHAQQAAYFYAQASFPEAFDPNRLSPYYPQGAPGQPGQPGQPAQPGQPGQPANVATASGVEPQIQATGPVQVQGQQIHSRLNHHPDAGSAGAAPAQTNVAPSVPAAGAPYDLRNRLMLGGVTALVGSQFLYGGGATAGSNGAGAGAGAGADGQPQNRGNLFGIPLLSSSQTLGLFLCTSGLYVFLGAIFEIFVATFTVSSSIPLTLMPVGKGSKFTVLIAFVLQHIAVQLGLLHESPAKIEQFNDNCRKLFLTSISCSPIEHGIFTSMLSVFPDLSILKLYVESSALGSGISPVSDANVRFLFHRFILARMLQRSFPLTIDYILGISKAVTKIYNQLTHISTPIQHRSLQTKYIQQILKEDPECLMGDQVIADLHEFFDQVPDPINLGVAHPRNRFYNACAYYCFLHGTSIFSVPQIVSDSRSMYYLRTSAMLYIGALAEGGSKLESCKGYLRATKMHNTSSDGSRYESNDDHVPTEQIEKMLATSRRSSASDGCESTNDGNDEAGDDADDEADTDSRSVTSVDAEKPSLMSGWNSLDDELQRTMEDVLHRMRVGKSLAGDSSYPIIYVFNSLECFIGMTDEFMDREIDIAVGMVEISLPPEDESFEEPVGDERYDRITNERIRSIYRRSLHTNKPLQPYYCRLTLVSNLIVYYYERDPARARHLLQYFVASGFMAKSIAGYSFVLVSFAGIFKACIHIVEKDLQNLSRSQCKQVERMLATLRVYMGSVTPDSLGLITSYKLRMMQMQINRGISEKLVDLTKQLIGYI